MRIGNRAIGRQHQPYIIAEMSGNHMGDYGRACDLIEVAREAGADAVKLQAFEPELIAQQRGGSDTIIQGGPWNGMLLGELYHKAWTPLEWFEGLVRVADAVGIQIFCSVFHPHLVDELEKIADWPAYKVASFNMSDAALLRRLQQTGKPLIVSTGMHSVDDLVEDDILNVYRNYRYHETESGKAYRTEVHGSPYMAVLHCVSEYPCPSDQVNLKRINQLAVHFESVGFSDHTRGRVAAIGAVARGACIIEKHLMLSRDDDCLDKEFSMTPHEFGKLVHDVRDVWCMMQEPDRADDTYAGMKVASA